MAYIDGFVLAVPTANKEQFIAHAQQADSAFIAHGALRVLECWALEPGAGKASGLAGAVAAHDDETVVFSWIEWPDKATRDALMARMDTLSQADARIDPSRNPMPFDAKRMIYGGFEPIVEQGQPSGDCHVQGFVIPVPTARRDDDRRMADAAWAMFQGLGARRVVEAWGDEVPEGRRTDFHRAVKAGADESIMFAFMEWPSRAVCDAAHEKMMGDKRTRPPDGMDLPFDAKRMIDGRFTPVVLLQR